MASSASTNTPVLNGIAAAASGLEGFDPAAGSLRDFVHTRPQRVEDRAADFEAWRSARENVGYWPYAKYLVEPPRATTTLQHSDGSRYSGVNFATQDYLSLSTHAAVKAAAAAAIERFGVHSAGSMALAGNVHESLALEASIADMLQMKHALLFPTGWAAGFGIVKGLVRQQDHVVLDALAHNCLQEGAMAATRNVYRTRHLDLAHVHSTLASIREKDAANTVLVVTEGIFSMDADAPDISALQAMCRHFGATLVVDVAHDLGCTGPGGTGEIGLQGMLGEVDIVMGSFSKTFASNGGFIATNRTAVKEFVRAFAPTCVFSNALSPVQVAAVGTAIAIIRSLEGEGLRKRLSVAVAALRDELTTCGFALLGKPHAIVPMIVGTEAVGRRAALEATREGVLVNLAEFPAVPIDRSRFRLQVMSAHEPEQCRAAARAIAKAVARSSAAGFALS
ncbi:MAG: aminotransferase class I/II-fold pyridoxal phosphate-dependent enzyme [Hydrocarboniphaga sp.]|uniref:aminotransferase class I/II-fold pyridoxal phosphate-dependent enzyme n=1 Tax=Hydrocarboniphaga sp. TaxID=2033016 RepID=UPI00262E8111|nr:aminotransferase class I/II-fold pyridoxal phosphate-dependent enzyme [Hydrocarboniphaga sp.]MDB5967913.1 aminotransferase class I/II-fold pyridoxal phosphate-dependent enzyme [Hydrocarboniphaga sp.]